MSASKAGRMTPRAVANDATARLRALGDRRNAEQGRTYFRAADQVALYGVRAPSIRALARELYQAVKPFWAVGDAVAFCDAMMRSRYLESKVLGALVLGRYRGGYERSLLGTVERWIVGGHAPNWAAVDGLAPEVLTPLVLSYPDLIPRVRRWTSSPNLWLRRAAVVTFVPLARKGEHLNTVYALVETLLDDPEDLLHKACGWLLREAGKADMSRLEGFLLRHGPRIPRTTVRYAIERFPERRRKRLLEKTRR
ncbi:MAG: hypothetical protein GTN62_14995 [Gemmatimonadales bacterium]|nr:hypothetical protein [Gemmatimonadales bacterium]NIN13393.1 hypothetical protein [Gemmatimonadales bacterium]NIN51396.1 hypothetical protein [Gemmatimonadales bacterium]NIP08860.1 hypothetical protein [Gemmatimonadales bacterium]NIQ99854.1 hypothetical protein [Gemmatimonadales bacterium]